MGTQSFIDKAALAKLPISRIAHLIHHHLDPAITVKKSPRVGGQYKWLLYPKWLRYPGQLIAFDTSREAWEHLLIQIDNHMLAEDIMADAEIYTGISTRHRVVRNLVRSYFDLNNLRYYQRYSALGNKTRRGIDKRRLYYLMYQRIDAHVFTLNTLIGIYNVELVLEPYRGEHTIKGQENWQYASFQDKE